VWVYDAAELREHNMTRPAMSSRRRILSLRGFAQPVAELIALLGYFFWSGPTFCRVLVMVQ
jgi:hypothetical protein